MIFTVKTLEFFLNQVKDLDQDSKRIIENKIKLVKENQYRYKRIRSNLFSRVFRIRLSIKNKATRLIYAIVEPDIILICLLEREKEYKDLEKYIKKLNPGKEKK